MVINKANILIFNHYIYKQLISKIKLTSFFIKKFMNYPPIVELKDDYLLITATGERRNFMDIIEGTIQIYEASKSLKTSRILADYRGVAYHVALNEAFNLVRYYENKLPEFQEVSMVGIVQTKDLEIAKFWESICNKRGFNVAVFTDFEAGEKWLLKQAVYN